MIGYHSTILGTTDLRERSKRDYDGYKGLYGRLILRALSSLVNNNDYIHSVWWLRTAVLSTSIQEIFQRHI